MANKNNVDMRKIEKVALQVSDLFDENNFTHEEVIRLLLIMLQAEQEIQQEENLEV